MEAWGIHWFRRDLRIVGNAALRENLNRTNGRTLGLFCLDRAFLARPDFSPNRFAFFLATLNALRAEWAELGGDLIVIDCPPTEAFARILAHCRKHKIAPPALVSWNRDYEPYARGRDAQIEMQLGEAAIPVFHARDHLLFEPHEVLKDDKRREYYQIYSPYGKKWFAALASDEGQSRIAEAWAKPRKKPRMEWREIARGGDFPWGDAEAEFTEKNKARVTVPIPAAGAAVALQELRKFRDRLRAYAHDRDFPAIRGTSRLSIYLKNGSLTVPQIIAELELGNPRWAQEGGATQYVKELAWREFYYSILFHRPQVEKKSYLQHYENIAWENNREWYDRWREGKTGFPIVDAGMRELRATGWMHNRVRMIVASFLTKDLLIDWRWGERHFMRELLDGDLAPNNGGWQWAASTGCDPQPYFRVFNPWLQGKKFDAQGEYIRRYVPELRDVPAKALHDPEADRGRCYCSPLVDHAKQRNVAISLYKNL